MHTLYVHIYIYLYWIILYTYITHVTHITSHMYTLCITYTFIYVFDWRICIRYIWLTYSYSIYLIDIFARTCIYSDPIITGLTRWTPQFCDFQIKPRVCPQYYSLLFALIENVSNRKFIIDTTRYYKILHTTRYYKNNVVNVVLNVLK